MIEHKMQNASSPMGKADALIDITFNVMYRILRHKKITVFNIFNVSLYLAELILLSPLLI